MKKGDIQKEYWKRVYIYLTIINDNNVQLLIFIHSPKIVIIIVIIINLIIIRRIIIEERRHIITSKQVSNFPY